MEVQDPKARAKANWLRAFNKVCMQLQEVSNAVADNCWVPAPAMCWASSDTSNPLDTPHPEGSGDLWEPHEGQSVLRTFPWCVLHAMCWCEPLALSHVLS